MQDDLELIKLLQEKDDQALSALYDRYSGAIYGVILRMCHEEEMAEELLQETFLKVWQKSHLYDPEKGKFYTWVYRIAKNSTLNALRRPKKLIQTEELSVYTDKSVDESQTDHTELQGAVQKLEPHHREAIDLVYFKGLTHREAHEEMGVPLGTFKSYIQQAIKGLRKNYKSAMLCCWLLIEIVG
ncbi:RNA polymerase sigma factor [Spongiimicrobium salis]|uniref:RNA polymerase sigma factor n=1 Tax=Spongiimicrobium salis TaxID=1667022 RepID=UPI00374D1623